jgi:peroxiredoxin Q/BCP
MLPLHTLAPDFDATLDTGEAFRLSQLRGEKDVVLYFYPRDFSRGCTTQACSFRDNYSEIREHDAVIIGVSGDSVESHRDFKEAHALPFPIISDPDGRLRDLYDVRSAIPLLRPRVTYVIDKQGIIRAAFRHDVAIGRHLSDTLAALEGIDATSP